MNTRTKISPMKNGFVAHLPQLLLKVSTQSALRNLRTDRIQVHCRKTWTFSRGLVCVILNQRVSHASIGCGKFVESQFSFEISRVVFLYLHFPGVPFPLISLRFPLFLILLAFRYAMNTFRKE